MFFLPLHVLRCYFPKVKFKKVTITKLSLQNRVKPLINNDKKKKHKRLETQALAQASMKRIQPNEEFLTLRRLIVEYQYMCSGTLGWNGVEVAHGFVKLQCIFFEIVKFKVNEISTSFVFQCFLSLCKVFPPTSQACTRLPLLKTTTQQPTDLIE